MTTTKTKQTFETAYRSLEKLVNEMESRNIGLEEGIAKFEQGLELAQFCKERLTHVENKVITIKKKFADVLTMAAPDDDDQTGRIEEEEDSDETQPGIVTDDDDEESDGETSA